MFEKLDIKDFLENYGFRLLFCVVLFLIVFLCIPSGLKLLRYKPSAPPGSFIEQSIPYIGLVLVIVGISILILACSIGLSEICKKNKAHIIAWDGYEEPDIYKPIMSRKPQFLTYLQPMDNLPLIDLRNGSWHNFDGIVLDLELIPRFRSGRTRQGKLLLDEIKRKDITNAMDGDSESKFPLHTICQRQVSGIATDGKAKYAVPLRMGFQELLCRTDALKMILGSNKFGRLKPHKLNTKVKIYSPVETKDTSDNIYHKDFSIQRILECDSLRIGLWHWYLPTFTSLSLMAGKKNNEMDFFSDENSRKTLDLIISNSSRFRILQSSSDVQISLTSDRNEDRPVDIVIGAGSWALSRNSLPKDIAMIIPSDGLPVFIDCFTLVNPSNSDAFHQRKKCIKWLEFMLSTKAQKQLCMKGQATNPGAEWRRTTESSVGEGACGQTEGSSTRRTNGCLGCEAPPAIAVGASKIA